MLHIAICDDESAERTQLRTWLTSYLTGQNIGCTFTEYSSGEPLCGDYEDQLVRFDLIFLDIFMGKMNGMEAATILRKFDPLVSIVFLTTSPDYAIDGYAVNADGYLLKPATEQQLSTVMKRLKLVLDQKVQNSILAGSRTCIRRILFNDICWLESQNKNVELHLVDGTMIVDHKTFTEVEESLVAPCFLKCNRGAIINMDYVVDVQETFLMHDGASISIKVRGRREIREQYFAYMLTKMGRKVD